MVKKISLFAVGLGSLMVFSGIAAHQYQISNQQEKDAASKQTVAVLKAKAAADNDKALLQAQVTTLKNDRVNICNYYKTKVSALRITLAAPKECQ